jgi:hypothetical protein
LELYRRNTGLTDAPVLFERKDLSGRYNYVYATLYVDYTRSSAYAAEFRNGPIASAAYYGIRVDAGSDGSTSYTLRAYGNGTEIGRLQDSSGTFQIIQVSDPRIKATRDGLPLLGEDGVSRESPSQVKALDVIRGLKHIEYRRNHWYEKGWSKEKTLAQPLVPVGYRTDNLLEVYPDAVEAQGMNFDNGSLPTFNALKWNSMIPIATKAIQEQQELIDALEKRVSELESQIAA